MQQRLLRVYLDGIDDWGRRGSSGLGTFENEDPLFDDARALVRSLQRDGAPIDDEGNLVLGAAPPVLPVERFDRLDEPRVLLQHLERIDAGIASDPAAAIGSAKELVESACKFILKDYGVPFDERKTDLLDLYKLVAEELKLSRESVPESAKGSRAAHKVLQNLSTAVQSLTELRKAGARPRPHESEPSARSPCAPRRQFEPRSRRVPAGDLARAPRARRPVALPRAPAFVQKR